MDTRKTLVGIVAMLAVASPVVADDVRELSWDELVPEGQTLQVPSHGSAGAGVGGEWDMEEDSFEEVFATPVFPMGVVEELNGERVKLPGFIVPLEVVDDGKVKEFLLVPYFGACIHYPAPPPNQIVYVTMPKAVEIESMWAAVWVTGEIRGESRHSDLADAGYSMTGEIIEDYEY